VDDSFAGGEDQTFDLANNGVALGKMSPEVPQELIDELDGLKQQIIDGEITVPTQ
jgi:basic membrane protein A